MSLKSYVCLEPFYIDFDGFVSVFARKMFRREIKRFESVEKGIHRVSRHIVNPLMLHRWLSQIVCLGIRWNMGNLTKCGTTQALKDHTGKL